VKRREFIAGLDGAAAWPVAARAQQPVKVWRVGYLSPASAITVSVALFDAFRLKLNDLGYVEGKNLGLYVRRADSRRNFHRDTPRSATAVIMPPTSLGSTRSTVRICGLGVKCR